MDIHKANIISRLQKEILPLQGYKPLVGSSPIDVGLNFLNNAFPNKEFPLGVVHEFLHQSIEDHAATNGFIAGILSSLMKREGITIWINSSIPIYPPALVAYGLDPSRIIFINTYEQKEVSWITEEALKSEGITAVVANLSRLDFKASRRLQLAVEESRVTGFILRPDVPVNTACLAKWKVSSQASINDEELPGVGFPQWRVELVKIRNGIPGSWNISWSGGRFTIVGKKTLSISRLQRKAG